MTEDAITPELREFIIKYLDTVADLEALLLLRAASNVRWNISDVAKRLYITDQQAKSVLTGLRQRGVLTEVASEYSLDGIEPSIISLVDQLSEAYSRHLIPITNIIHDKSRRIREFADAFKLKRDR